jgi:hypothetical protein
MVRMLLLGLLLLALVCYPAIKLQWSRHQVEGFCANVPAGGAIAGLAAQARADGLKTTSSAMFGTKRKRLTVWEGWFGARYSCYIVHQNGRVITASFSAGQ